MLPVSIVLKAQTGSYLLLSSYKIELGKAGVEEGNSLEIYHSAARIWGSITWDAPIQVDGRHQPYLLRYTGIVQMPSLNECLPKCSDGA